MEVTQRPSKATLEYYIDSIEENINDINFAMQLSKFMDSSFIRFWNVDKIMILTHKIILLLPLIDGTGLLYVYTQIIHQILKTSFFYKEFVLSSPDITILMDKLKPLIDHKLFLVKIPQLILVIMQHSPDAHQYLYGIFGFLIEYINDNYLINDSLLELAYQLINHNFQEENENDNDVFYNTLAGYTMRIFRIEDLTMISNYHFVICIQIYTKLKWELGNSSGIYDNIEAEVISIIVVYIQMFRKTSYEYNYDLIQCFFKILNSSFEDLDIVFTVEKVDTILHLVYCLIPEDTVNLLSWIENTYYDQNKDIVWHIINNQSIYSNATSVPFYLSFIQKHIQDYACIDFLADDLVCGIFSALNLCGTVIDECSKESKNDIKKEMEDFLNFFEGYFPTLVEGMDKDNCKWYVIHSVPYSVANLYNAIHDTKLETDEIEIVKNIMRIYDTWENERSHEEEE